jgi:predicted RNA-binding protein with PUA-like domain
MNYWLMKSEPEEFGIDHLVAAKNKTSFWDGIRNYQARNMLRDTMQIGDLAFFYHSSCKVPGIVGIIKIVSVGYPDPTQFDPKSCYFDPKSSPDVPRWYGVDVQLVEKFKDVLPLTVIKQNLELHSMRLVQPGNRLSITPVSVKEWQIIVDMLLSLN